MEPFRNPVEYIAPEIWTHIFSFLQSSYHNENNPEGLDPSDMYSLFQVCSTFRNILHSTRVTWMFHEIVPILAKYITSYSLLTCRSVCKPWRHGVDYHLEHLPPHSSSKQITCPFTTSTSIPLFLNSTIFHFGNPFPGRRVEIFFIDRTYRRRGQFEDFWGHDVLQLLTRFGAHIHSLHLTLPILMVISRLKRYLELVPNLKRLYLGTDSSELFSHVESSLDLMWAPPPLPFLESLYFTQENKFPGKLQYSLAILYQDQLKHLKISLADFTSQCPFQLPILEDLEVHLASPQQLSSVLSYSNSNYSRTLHHLIIKIVNVQDNLAEYLQNLHWFETCLVDLTLISHGPEIVTLFERDLQPLGNLKRLKYLHLKNFVFDSVSIICKLPVSLQCLSMGKGKHDVGQFIAFHYLDLPDEEQILQGTVIRKHLPNLREMRYKHFHSKMVVTYKKEGGRYRVNFSNEKPEKNEAKHRTNFVMVLVAVVFLGIVMIHFVTVILAQVMAMA